MRYFSFFSPDVKKVAAVVGGLFLAFCLFAICAPDAGAQGFMGGYQTAADGMNTLSGGAMPSAAGNPALGRARAMQGGYQQPYGSPGYQQPYGAPGYQQGRYYDEDDEEYWDEEDGDYYGYMPQEMFVYIPTPIEKVIPAVRGRRVYDAVTYKVGGAGEALILDDYRSLKITEEDKDHYSDEGEQGDWVARDGLYSDMEPVSTSEYMGGTTFYNLKQNVAILRATQEVDPLDFFGLTALTTERFSRIDSLRARIQQQNDKIHRIDEGGDFSGWSNKFLKNYRTESLDPDSGFYPLYVPEPPEAPSTPRPILTWWRPPNSTDTPWDLTIENMLDLNEIKDLDKRAENRALVEAKALEDPLYKDQMLAMFGPPASVIASYRLVHPEMFPEDAVQTAAGYAGGDEEYYDDEEDE